MAAAATLADLQSPGADEASLNSWKESLGLNSGGTPSDDHRKVIVKALICRVEGRPDIRLDLTQANLKSQNLTIALKEDTEYNLVVQFRIQHKVVSGLTYAHMIKRLGTTVEKRQELLGAYGSNSEDYQEKFEPELAPSGKARRGNYSVTSKVSDFDEGIHLEWKWTLEIKADW